MKTYAYVSSECCLRTRAFLPGSVVDGTPIAKHGDYWRWTLGKRETLKRAADHNSAYERRAARTVAELLDWSEA